MTLANDGRMMDSGFLVIAEYERRLEYARAEKDLGLPGGWQQIARHANVMNP